VTVARPSAMAVVNPRSARCAEKLTVVIVVIATASDSIQPNIKGVIQLRISDPGSQALYSATATNDLGRMAPAGGRLQE
jgi:hypothetical protein